MNTETKIESLYFFGDPLSLNLNEMEWRDFCSRVKKDNAFSDFKCIELEPFTEYTFNHFELGRVSIVTDSGFVVLCRRGSSIWGSDSEIESLSFGGVVFESQDVDLNVIGDLVRISTHKGILGTLNVKLGLPIE